MNALYKLFIGRILYLSVFFQVLFCVSFAMMQVPNFLGIVRGVKFSLLDLLIILSLRVLEWLNFITILTFAIALLFFTIEMHKKNLFVFFLQIGRPISDFIKPIFYLTIFYGMLFVFIDGFFVPYGKIYLKKKMIELYKENFIHSIQPMHIVSYEDWNFAVSARQNENKLNGVILNKENFPELTVLINEINFKSTKNINLTLKKGLGKIKINERKFLISLESGEVFASEDYVAFKNQSKYLSLFDMNIFNNNDLYEIFKRTWLFFVSLMLSLWIFILFFSEFQYVKIITSCSLLFMLLFAIEVIPFNFTIFFGLMLIIILFYRKTKLLC